MKYFVGTFLLWLAFRGRVQTYLALAGAPSTSKPASPDKASSPVTGSDFVSQAQKWITDLFANTPANTGKLP